MEGWLKLKCQSQRYPLVISTNYIEMIQAQCQLCHHLHLKGSRVWFSYSNFKQKRVATFSSENDIHYKVVQDNYTTIFTVVPRSQHLMPSIISLKSVVATVSKSYILLILLFRPRIIIAKCIKFFT